MDSISWTIIIQDIISGIIASIIVAVFGYIFLQHYSSKLNFSKKMESYGISSSSTKAQTQKEIAEMLNNAKEIKIMFISGINYLKKHSDRLKEFAEKPGRSVKILLANENSPLLTDIEDLEMSIGEREVGTHIASELDKVDGYFASSNVQIARYNTEYRLPYVIAIYPDGTEKAWLTVTLPPYRSRVDKSFVLRGVKKKGAADTSDEFDFLYQLNLNFDTIWEKYHK